MAGGLLLFDRIDKSVKLASGKEYLTGLAVPQERNQTEKVSPKSGITVCCYWCYRKTPQKMSKWHYLCSLLIRWKCRY